jgi:hypothetical protein
MQLLQMNRPREDTCSPSGQLCKKEAELLLLRLRQHEPKGVRNTLNKEFGLCTLKCFGAHITAVFRFESEVIHTMSTINKKGSR